MARLDGFQVAPTSRASIRQQAHEVLNYFKCQGYCPVVDILDIELPREIPKFRALYPSQAEMLEKFGPGVEGMTFPDDNLIYIREDVYLRACNNDGRARFSIAHEIGHYCIHGGVGLARRARHTTPIYCNSEWQADTFAGELLADSRCVRRGDSISDLIARFGLSHEAACVRWTQLQGEGLI